MGLIWILSGIHVYSFGIDRQRLIHMKRQVTLNIRCAAEEMKQHTQTHDFASGLANPHSYNIQYFIRIHTQRNTHNQPNRLHLFLINSSLTIVHTQTHTDSRMIFCATKI